MGSAGAIAPAYVIVTKLLDGTTANQTHASLELRPEESERVLHAALAARGESKKIATTNAAGGPFFWTPNTLFPEEHDRTA